MKQFKYNKFLILLIVIGLLASLVIDVERHQVEQQNKSIELVMDYEDLVELAEKEGVQPEAVLAKAKEAGVTSLAVYETTFKKLNVNGKAVAVNGSTILANYQNGGISDAGWRSLVESGSEASARELIELITLVEEQSLPAIFTEASGSTSAASIIARETGCGVFSLDMAMAGDSYFDAMYHNIDTIKEALG